eukprot:10333857-Alexandrium_andersonii.AAC.1
MCNVNRDFAKTSPPNTTGTCNPDEQGGRQRMFQTRNRPSRGLECKVTGAPQTSEPEARGTVIRAA